jgi:hypothetical protein
VRTESASNNASHGLIFMFTESKCSTPKPPNWKSSKPNSRKLRNA